jgi:DNA transposase THAP9
MTCKILIFEIIQKHFNVGLNVKMFITDMGSNFVSFSKNVNVTPARPFFKVGENKIIYIFDPPHLLKSTRNMFYQHNLKFNNNLIEKKYLISFFEQNSNLRAAPKLTNSHIFPGPFEKMKVFLAAQVFSQSVAAGMNSEY